MSRAFQDDVLRNDAETRATILNPRERIIAVAAAIVSSQPESFSVQRVARAAGLSARAIYGHFSSGKELEQAAQLSLLHTIRRKLPEKVNPETSVSEALEEFAQLVANAISPYASGLMIACRQSEKLRSEYHHWLRAPLIYELAIYIRSHRFATGHIQSDENELAELLLIAIESIVATHHATQSATISLGDALNKVVRGICVAYLDDLKGAPQRARPAI